MIRKSRIWLYTFKKCEFLWKIFGIRRNDIFLEKHYEKHSASNREIDPTSWCVKTATSIETMYPPVHFFIFILSVSGIVLQFILAHTCTISHLFMSVCSRACFSKKSYQVVTGIVKRMNEETELCGNEKKKRENLEDENKLGDSTEP